MAPDYAAADLVIVNTGGFIDAAVGESLEAIGEAMDRKWPGARYRMPSGHIEQRGKIPM